jgi:gamma-glutamyltranspeptidase
MVRPDLAKTLDIIAHNATEFYYGSLARDVLNDLREIGLSGFCYNVVDVYE